MGHAGDGSDQRGRRGEVSQAAVIVGLDGRKHDADALALARSLGTVLGGHLVLAHVVPPAPLGSLAALAPMEQVASGRTFLTRAAAKLARGSTTEFVDSLPAAVGLADPAVKCDASMLVLGSSHRGPVGRIVPGSTASRLLGRSPCAVAVAPMGYASAEPTSTSVIGIAYDGTSESEAALEAAAAMAAKLSVPLRLYHAVQQAPEGSGSNPTPRHTYELARSTIEAGSRRIPRDVDVTPSVLEGIQRRS